MTTISAKAGKSKVYCPKVLTLYVKRHTLLPEDKSVIS